MEILQKDREYYLSASLLSANFYNLENDLNILKEEKIKYLHLDVMDGVFVPNISYGMPIINSLKKQKGDFIFDTHLMITEPIRYIQQFKDAGCDIITVHYEACKDCKNTLQEIKNNGLKAGLAIKPKTKTSEIYDLLELCDLVLVMSVEPGFGGQRFMEDSLQKIVDLKNKRSEKNINFVIEIDGGINCENIEKVVNAGVKLVVAGSSVFNGDIKENIKKLTI